jgi:hypothetical protein
MARCLHMSEISCPGGERLQSKIAAPERRDSLSLSAFHEISTSASLNGFKLCSDSMKLVTFCNNHRHFALVINIHQ